jgi:ADP-heptose:LPS heptosyltransferase
MSRQTFLQKIISSILRKFLAVDERMSFRFETPKKVLIIRQHNQFGDLLASVSLFRAIKETYPKCSITLIVSSENHYAVEKNEFIDELFIYDKRKLIEPAYLQKVKNAIRQNFDLAIVPVTVAISKTSCLIAALSDAKIKIGPKSLDGADNNISFVFHYPIALNWKKCPDAHVSDFILDIVRPFGISTKNYGTSISYDMGDARLASDFLERLDIKKDDYIIGFHIGAGKPPNRWPLEKFIKLIYLLNNYHSIKIYFTGTKADKDEIDYVQSNLGFDAGYFLNKSIPQLTALIAKSDLFITNDTGVMHVAGATRTPQISIFGPTNPFNWAPVGLDKYFQRKSDLISDVDEEMVFNLCKYILEKKNK